MFFLRLCGNYCCLNTRAEADHYPLPNVSDITTFLHNARIIIKLDLTKGYYQAPMAPKTYQKTAIATLFGMFTFSYSCFGLRNAGVMFQMMMNSIIGDFLFCVVYIDDILIFSRSKDDLPEAHPQGPSVTIITASYSGLTSVCLVAPASSSSATPSLLQE